MLFATLPNTPVSAPKGIAHLLVVALVGGISFIGTLLLAILDRPQPEIFTVTNTMVVGYLVGVNAAAKNNPTKDDSPKDDS